MNAPPALSDHLVPDGFEPVPPPLTRPAPSPRPAPAEAARTLLAQTRVGPVRGVMPGDPWGSFAVALSTAP